MLRFQGCTLSLAAACAWLQGTAGEVIKGVSYGPVPLRTAQGASEVPADDWFCDEAVPMWGEEGRGDLAVMRQLGANLVRLYGNDPRQHHGNFLDEALANGLSVAPGMSDYPYYQQVPGSCLHDTDFDCFTQVTPLYLQNLQNGFLTPTNQYHPALKYMNIVNEPDLKIPHDADTGDVQQVYRMCRAIISAFDGMLEAEKTAGVTGSLINFTATFSFAICSACEFSNGKPALAQMAQLDDAMRNPQKYDYSPRNDITAAYEARWTHSFNTANPAHDVEMQFLNPYEEVFPNTPVYIAEYHRVGINQTQDVGLILEIAESRPLFLGISYFQYEVAYWKTGSEMAFGMFGLGDKVLASMPYFGKIYDIYCLTLEGSQASGESLPQAIAQVYGGPGLDEKTLCANHPDGMPLDQAGYLRIAGQRSVGQMSRFVKRVLHHMGATVKAGHEAQFEHFAADFASDTRGDAFARLAGYVGSHQAPWTDFDSEARCVADRNAKPSVVGSAVGWVCSQNVVDCSSVPPECNSSVYTIGDYIFSRYARQAPGTFDPLNGCNFGGAALFAPAWLYERWTLAGMCVVDGATTTPWRTAPSTTPALPASTSAGATTSSEAEEASGSSSTGHQAGTTVHHDIPSGGGFLSTSAAPLESTSQAGLRRSPWISAVLSALLAVVVAWP